MLLHGVYVTAERAALPNIVDEDDLITANAIDSASWSTALCVGAMLGGIVVSIWGTDLAFIIDSYTFLLSSLLLIPLTFEQKYDESVKGPIIKTAISNIKIGWSRIYHDKKLLRIVFAKSSWNLAGAGLDCFEQEPPSSNLKLLNSGKVIVSPHNASLTAECTRRLGLVCIENVVDALTGCLKKERVVNWDAVHA